MPSVVRESAVVSWLGDAWEALQETADEALIAARKAARKTNDEQWRRYEAKVGQRRAEARAKPVIEGHAGPAKSALPMAADAEEPDQIGHPEPAIGEHASPRPFEDDED